MPRSSYLDILDAKAELAERLLLSVGLQLTKRDLNNALHEGLLRCLLTGGLRGDGLAHLGDGEAVGRLQVEPILAEERINAANKKVMGQRRHEYQSTEGMNKKRTAFNVRLLAAGLLLLAELLVLPDRHCPTKKKQKQNHHHQNVQGKVRLGRL